MDEIHVLVYILLISFNLVSGQNTPCPGTFDFESDGANIYGKIVLKPSGPLTSLLLRINFTIATKLFSNYVGRIEAEDSNQLLQKYNRGIPVQYRVHFPVTSPMPKLTALTVNGNTICYGPGDAPRPNTYITTLSLQHTSFIQGGTSFDSVPQISHHQVNEPVLNLVGQYGEDTHIYTFTNVENSPSWNNGYSPFYIVSNSKQTTTMPVYLPFYPQPSRPNQDNSNQYDNNSQYNDRYDPTNQYDNRRPSDQAQYELTTMRPVYEPQTRPPTQPAPDPVYYPERTTTPRPVITQPPIQKPDDQAPSSNECGVVAGGNEKVPLVHNGKSYARGDVPWLVAIYKSDGGTLSFICGGTLVSDRHVITAAHCMQRRSILSSIKDFVVKVGVYNLNDWSDDITITRTLISAAIHESYNATTLENDILVFTFNKRVEFNTYIRPACLWGGNTELNRIVGASGVVAGWGDQGVKSSGREGEPQLVRIPIVSTAVCRASKPHFHWLTSSNTLCAGDRNGAGPCKGDSGGGLYLLDSGKWRLRGVVSISLRPENGDNTCNLNEYIVFTDTAQYLPWIRSVIAENYYDK